VHLVHPAAVVLDLLLPQENAWDFLAELKSDEASRGLPVLVVSVLDDQRKAFLLGADAYYVKPVQRDWLLGKLRTLAGDETVRKILVIDDEETSRYVVRSMLSRTPLEVVEAADGAEGLAAAAREKPAVILLDLVMPEMDGFEVLERLKADPATRDIPVIINTASRLTDVQRERLLEEAHAVVSKNLTTLDEAFARLKDALGKAGLEITSAA
jgi:CheY-like chemotaxis protein